MILIKSEILKARLQCLQILNKKINTFLKLKKAQNSNITSKKTIKNTLINAEFSH